MIVAAKEASTELGDGRVSDESEIFAELLTCVSGDMMFNDGFVELDDPTEGDGNARDRIIGAGDGSFGLLPFNTSLARKGREPAEATGLCFTAAAGLLRLTMLST